VGITADTPTNLVVGAGEFLLNHANVGATVDDNAFRIEREIFTPELNGAKGALVGTDYVTSSEGVLEVLDNAINVGNVEATLGDDSLAAPRMELHSRWDPANLTVSPHRIRILDVAS
jgi:hypothetical protein